MSLTIYTEEILSETRYPFRTPNPTETVKTIIDSLSDLEKQVDSSQVESTVTEIETGGTFFGTNSRPCFDIKLKNAKVSMLKKLGCCIFPVEFGNLVYLNKFEYMGGGIFDYDADNRVRKLKKKLNTIDKWMEYTFIQTMGDFIFVEMLRKFDPAFKENLPAYKAFFTVE